MAASSVLFSPSTSLSFGASHFNKVVLQTPKESTCFIARHCQHITVGHIRFRDIKSYRYGTAYNVQDPRGKPFFNKRLSKCHRKAATPTYNVAQ
jgi:hypothetical protein